MREVIRGLTQEEAQLLAPEVQAYQEGMRAKERLQRMLRLIAPEGTVLDFQTGELVRFTDDDDRAV